MVTERNRWIWAFRWLWVAAFVVVLFAGLRAQPWPQPLHQFDKLLHFSAFLGLTGLFLLARPGRWQWWGLVAIALFGLGIEYGQGLLLERRHASLADALANLVGILVALVLVSLWRRWRA